MAPTESAGPYTAVVTGASGFVASEVVKQLLIKGWNVRGTVRSLSKKDKVQHLQALGEVCKTGFWPPCCFLVGLHHFVCVAAGSTR